MTLPQGGSIPSRTLSISSHAAFTAAAIMGIFASENSPDLTSTLVCERQSRAAESLFAGARRPGFRHSPRDIAVLPSAPNSSARHQNIPRGAATTGLRVVSLDKGLGDAGRS